MSVITERHCERSTPFALAVLQAPLHGLRAVDELRQDKGEGVVRGDAPRGELLDELVALLGAGALDHHVRVDGVNLEGLLEHGLVVEGAARIDLAGQEALLVPRRLEQRQEHVGALADHLLVEEPEQAFGVEPRVLLEDPLGDPLPARRVVLDGRQRQRRVGGDAAEQLPQRGVSVVHALELALEVVLVARFGLGEHLRAPVAEDDGRGIPPDLHAGTDRDQILQKIALLHVSPPNGPQT